MPGSAALEGKRLHTTVSRPAKTAYIQASSVLVNVLAPHLRIRGALRLHDCAIRVALRNPTELQRQLAMNVLELIITNDYIVKTTSAPRFRGDGFNAGRVSGKWNVCRTAPSSGQEHLIVRRATSTGSPRLSLVSSHESSVYHFMGSRHRATLQ